jgi:hypothetical protein
MRVAAWLFAVFSTVAPPSALAAPAAPAAPEFERVALAEPTAVSTQPGPFSPEAIAAIEKALGAGAAASVAEAAVAGRWPKRLGAPQYSFAHYARLTLRRICDLGGSKHLLVARALENAHLEPDVRPEADVYFVVDAAGVVPRPAPKGWPKGFGNQLAWLIDDLFAVDSRLAAVDRPTARHKTNVAQSEPIEGAVEARRREIPGSGGLPADRTYLAAFGPYPDKAAARSALDALIPAVAKVVAKKRRWERVPDDEIDWEATATWLRERPANVGGSSTMLHLHHLQTFNSDVTPAPGWWVTLRLSGHVGAK